MALLSDYTAGTVSSSGLVITGTGTAWQTAQFREGDEFIAGGWRMLVQSVDSETRITLRANSGVQGAALSGAPYRLRYMSDGSRASSQARQLIDMLGGTGTLEGLAGLTTAANKMPYFTGPGGAAALADLTPFARTLLDDTNAAAARATLSVRERLTASRTYYVRPDGNDANNGLSNTSGGAFLTLQRAWNVVAALDLSIYSVTIQVADGTYTAGISATAMPVGGSAINIVGNISNPANCHINMTASNFTVNSPPPCPMSIKGFRGTFAGAGAQFANFAAPGRFEVANIVLSGGGTGFVVAISAAVKSAWVIISGPITVDGNMPAMIGAISGIVQFFSTTVTMTGTPTFSWATVVAARQGYMIAPGITFVGGATGKRFSVNNLSVIETSGGGASYFPGSDSGSTSNGGLYL